MYGDGCSIKGTDLPSDVFNPFGQGQTLNAYDAGGNALSAIFTLAAWSGAEKEEAAPFNADTTDKEQEMINTMTARLYLRLISQAIQQILMINSLKYTTKPFQPLKNLLPLT